MFQRRRTVLDRSSARPVPLLLRTFVPGCRSAPSMTSIPCRWAERGRSSLSRTRRDDAIVEPIFRVVLPPSGWSCAYGFTWLGECPMWGL